MSKFQKRSFALLGALTLIVLVLVAAFSSLSFGRAPTEPVRIILLETAGPTYTMGKQINPTLRVRQGEMVRLVLKNYDTGTLHALEAPAFSNEIVQVAPGEEGSIEFRADRSGEFEYRCPQHCPLMRGRIVVTSSR
jgi:FtsP/CotA-like multicopper oxidase with cupredoxin domain